MIYLIEIEALDPASGAVVVERFATSGFTTKPLDTPADTHFVGRIEEPGNYQRSVFGAGRTGGSTTMSFGFIELSNPDGGIDAFGRYAVDGRALRIFGLAGTTAPWSSRVQVLAGTMEQVELSWRTATIRLRDRTAELAKPVQPLAYAGTTTHGGLNEAEGAEDDLKDKPKPTLWGRVLNVSPVLANRYDLIWQLSSRPLAAVDAVRDNGVPLAFHANYATIAALRGATIPAGRYATALALGLIRTGSTPAGDLTVDAREGATGQRSAASTARRVLEHAGLVANVDFVPADFASLHALAPAEVGTWTGIDRRYVAAVLSDLLGSIGAWIMPDRLGRFRVGRIDAPVFSPAAPVIDRAIMLEDGQGIERLATADDGNGVPAKSVTLRYARNWTVQGRATLDATAASEATRAFAVEEYRNVTAEDAAVAARHLLAAELTFDSAIVEESAATAEAARRLALYGARRDRYRVPLKAEEVVGIELGSTVTLTAPRFDLSEGKAMVVIGEEVRLADGVVTLDLWG